MDRMDYLLRDSHHIGVAYGKFDHHRLIDTMRILPTFQGSNEPTLGISDGGIHVAEALLLARYSMFMQAFTYHRTRVAYDCLLRDFLGEWLPSGRFPDNDTKIQSYTDDTVLPGDCGGIKFPANAKGQVAANRILNRQHFRLLFREKLTDWGNGDELSGQDPAKLVYDASAHEFGAENVRYVNQPPREADLHFPVVGSDRMITPSTANSETLNTIPAPRFGIVLIAPELLDAGLKWVGKGIRT